MVNPQSVAFMIQSAVACDMAKRASDAGLGLKIGDFAVGVEPSGKPIVTIRVAQGKDFFCKMEPIFDAFADFCTANKLSGSTFREMNGNLDQSPIVSYLEFRAENWPDMVHGLNVGLPPENRIDSSVLGIGIP